MSDKNKKFPHDASYKEFFSYPAMVASLLRDFVREPFVPEMDMGTLERLSGEYVGKGFVKGFSDTVWRARWRKREWCYVALLLEFQSKPDPLMPFRLASYTLQLLLRLAKEDKNLRAGRFPAVLPIVFYTGDALWNAPLNTSDMFGPLPAALGEYLVRQKYVLIDLCRLDAGGPELRDSLTALMARFRQAKTIEEVEAILEDMARVLKDYPELQKVFAQWAAMSLFYSGVPGNWDRQVNTIEEVRNMVRFDVPRWQEQWRAEGMAAGLAQGMARGMAEGMAKGHAEGRDEGRAENQRATALQLVKMGRFTLEDIAEITSLSLDDVRAIAAENGR